MQGELNSKRYENEQYFKKQQPNMQQYAYKYPNYMMFLN